MKITPRFRSFVLSFAILIAGMSVAAQERPAAPTNLDNLREEIRELRRAVDQANRKQAELQSIAVLLTVQQTRLSHLSDRLDAVRAHLNAATQRSQEAAALIAGAEKEAASAASSEEREHAAGMVQLFKQQAAGTARREQELRDRESELSQVYAVEEARWTELVARLEQAVK